MVQHAHRRSSLVDPGSSRQTADGSADSALAGLGDPLVVMDDLGDDEREELLGELGIEVRLLGQTAQTGDLSGLTGLVGGREPMVGLELPDGLGEFESLREEVDEGGVDVVDAAAQLEESVLGSGVVRHRISLTATHALRPGTRPGSRGAVRAATAQAGCSTGTASLVSGSVSVPALRSARYFLSSFLTTGMRM